VLARVAKESTSAEVRMRARRILGWADRTPRFSAADARRLLRVLHAVEPFPSPEATTIVLLIVQEFPDPQVKREAERLLRNWKSEPRAKG